MGSRRCHLHRRTSFKTAGFTWPLETLERIRKHLLLTEGFRFPLLASAATPRHYSIHLLPIYAI